MSAPCAPSYSRIMLVRTDRIGDLVLSTPAIASFRRSWPAARIEALVNDYNEPVLRHNPDVDVLHVLPRTSSPASARAFARRLGAGVDLAVALAPRSADHLLAAWTRAARRIGYVYRRRYLSRLFATWLLDDYCISDADPLDADRRPDIPVPHEVRQVLALVALAGGARTDERLVLRTGDEDADFAARRVVEGALALNLSPRWFSPTFGFDATRALIVRLARERRSVVVTYGTDSSAQAQALRASIDLDVVWLGNLSVLQWAAALARCSVVVTVDTGATHVASAMGVPVVVVFERRYYRLCSQEWSPWRVPHVSLSKPASAAQAPELIEQIAEASHVVASMPGARSTGNEIASP